MEPLNTSATDAEEKSANAQNLMEKVSLFWLLYYFVSLVLKVSLLILTVSLVNSHILLKLAI